jgi:hypothetical protein
MWQVRYVWNLMDNDENDMGMFHRVQLLGYILFVVIIDIVP